MLLAASLAATAAANKKVAAKYVQENLTLEMWPHASHDKMVFVKMFDPKCKPCALMQPDWDRLMADYRDSDTLLVADIDCTTRGGRKLCEQLTSIEFPTLRYGDPLDLKKYTGNRTYDDMAEFAAGIGGLCRPWSLDHCSDKQKEQVNKYQAMTQAGRDERIKSKDKKIHGIKQAFYKFQHETSEGFKNAKLQPQATRVTYIEDLSQKHDEAKLQHQVDVEKIQDTGLGILKAIHADAELPEEEQRMNLKKQKRKAVPMTKEEVEEWTAKMEL